MSFLDVSLICLSLSLMFIRLFCFEYICQRCTAGSGQKQTKYIYFFGGRKEMLFSHFLYNSFQILRLFSESSESIGVLKVDLGEAKRRLSSRNKQLHQLWYRSVTLRHIISLLDQIEGISKVCLILFPVFGPYVAQS